MSVAAPKKRKSFGNQNESQQSTKKFKPGKQPNGRTPKGPGNVAVHIKKEPVTPKPKMFGGTKSLGFSESNIKKEPVSVKKEPFSAKKEHKRFKPGKMNQGDASDKKDTVNQSNKAEVAANRHKRRREKHKAQKKALRAKQTELKIKLKAGDADARREMEGMISDLEKKPQLSITNQKHLTYYKMLMEGATRPWKKAKQEVKGSEPAKLNKNQAQKKLNKGKPVQTQVGKQVKGPIIGKKKVGKQQQNQGTKKKQNQVPQKAPQKEEPDSDDSEESETDNKVDASMEEEEGSAEEAATDEDDSSGENEEESDAEEEKDNEESEEDEESEEGSEDEEGSDEDAEAPVEENKLSRNKNKPQAADKNQKNLNLASLGMKNQGRYIVFVGNLPYTATKEELGEHFHKVGEIVDIRIPTEQGGTKPKGFAYVELKTSESYEKALSLHHTFVGGRRINVLYTQSGNKSSNSKKQEIKAKNFKLNAMRQQGKLSGSVKADQKRSVRRAKKKQFGKNE